jgi:hypothetical protein
MDVNVVETDMNGIPAREITCPWKIIGEIVFHAQPAIRGARETIWWRII